MNTTFIHKPERRQDESMDAYRERRSASKSSAEAMSLTGPFTPRGQSSRSALRDAQRSSGAMRKVAGAYGRGLLNWITNKNNAQQANRHAKRMAAIY